MVDYIKDGMAEVELITLKYVVEMLKKYPVQLVIEQLEEEIKEKEAKSGK